MIRKPGLVKGIYHKKTMSPRREVTQGGKESSRARKFAWRRRTSLLDSNKKWHSAGSLPLTPQKTISVEVTFIPLSEVSWKNQIEISEI